MVITKVELGLFDQFFSNPHQHHGHLTSPMLFVQLWYETESHGLILCLAPYATWVIFLTNKVRFLLPDTQTFIGQSYQTHQALIGTVVPLPPYTHASQYIERLGLQWNTTSPHQYNK
jgi:hypothetical protein